MSDIAAEVRGVLARYRETAIALSDDPAALAALSKAVLPGLRLMAEAMADEPAILAAYDQIEASTADLEHLTTRQGGRDDDGLD